ncbi:MAG: esterase [Campylobacterales bacterium]|nr:esterase [Campylobacterales bacterium]
MILYLHGFASSARGSKARLFCSLTCNEPIYAPTLSTIPDLAIESLCGLIELLQKSSDPKLREVKLVGSSLGGYYARYLALRYGLRAVLINPALRPYERLREALGQMTHYGDLSRFEWNEAHLNALKRFDLGALQEGERLLVLLQKGDELLDYREAETMLEGARIMIEEGGSHAFEGIEHQLRTISDFFQTPLTLPQGS